MEYCLSKCSVTQNFKYAFIENLKRLNYHNTSLFGECLSSIKNKNKILDSERCFYTLSITQSIKHWYTVGIFPPLDNIRIIPFSNLLHRHTEHPKSKVTDKLPAKDGSSNNGISKYIDVALHN